jgi:hypothetical protein
MSSLIQIIQQRLENTPGIDRVGLALNLASAVERRPDRDVECFVFPVSERPTKDKRATGRVLQEVVITVGVVIAIRALNDAHQERSTDRLETARNTVRELLLGWTPEGTHVRLIMAGGDLVRMVSGGIYWLDKFETKVQRQSV